jgi:hypothetical protein
MRLSSYRVLVSEDAAVPPRPKESCRAEEFARDALSQRPESRFWHCYDSERLAIFQSDSQFNSYVFDIVAIIQLRSDDLWTIRKHSIMKGADAILLTENVVCIVQSKNVQVTQESLNAA